MNVYELQEFPDYYYGYMAPGTGYLKYFDLIYVMTGGGPKDSTYVLVYYIYKLAFDYHRTGYGSAVAGVLFLILLIITIIQYVHNNKQD